MMRLFSTKIQDITFLALNPSGRMDEVTPVINMTQSKEKGLVINISSDLSLIVTESTPVEKLKGNSTVIKKIRNAHELLLCLDTAYLSGKAIQLGADFIKNTLDFYPSERPITYLGSKDSVGYLLTSKGLLYADPADSLESPIPGLRIPIVSNYLFNITSQPMEGNNTFTQIQSEKLNGTEYYINYSLNTLFPMEERIKVTDEVYGEYLTYENYPKEVIYDYISKKVTDLAEEVDSRINLLEREDIVEAFKDDLPPIDIKIVDKLFELELDELAVKDYAYKYLTHVKEMKLQCR